MGGNYKITNRDAAVLQLCSFVVIPLLPIIWVVIILMGIVKVLIRPDGAKDVVYSTAGTIAVVAFIPFLITWVNITGLVLGFVAFIYSIFEKQPQASVVGSPEYRSARVDRGAPVARSAKFESSISNPDRRDPVLPTYLGRYRYSPLQEVDNFRILLIFPGSNDDPLSGQLINTSLSEIRHPTYDALSYTWADETGDASLSRQFLCQGIQSTIPITKNCEAAIRHLRHPEKKRRVWIDAICINQKSPTECTHQVSLMSRIYTSARSVVVYTGEGTAHTDRVFNWLNNLNAEDLDIPLRWEFDNLAGDVLISLSRYWEMGRERLLALTRDSRVEDTMSESELIDLAQEYFSTRWFRRVWVLQEVALPDIRNITVMCGTKTTSAIRALHALSLLHRDSSGSVVRILVLLRRRIKHIKIPHLLDILIETRDREAQDPRDRIFGVLGISHTLDGKVFQDLQANYAMATQEVYAQYSALFMQYHGPGFFLALIKSPPIIKGLPSWSADWTAPWPNRKAVHERDFAACSRPANDIDGGATFSIENGHHVLTLVRSRILDGYFTKDGHLDDATGISIVGLESLGEDDVLIEMYPGLAALLKKKNENEDNYYSFVQVCPHALSENGVKDLLDRWDSVVTDASDPNNKTNLDSALPRYLSDEEIFKIQ